MVGNQMSEWLKKNKIELIIVFFIVLLGAFLRFYQIQGHATFLGDEGRDALIVKRMIVDHKFTMLGPTVSFGNLYLGPAYYYMMAIPLWLSNLNPVGPAMMVAGLSVLTILLIWKAAGDFFGGVTGLMAASLYAVSPLVIRYAHSSWNPNPMPFFSLLAIYGLFRTIRDKKGKWLILVGASLGLALQLHYMAAVLIFSVPVIFLFLKVKISWKWYLLGFFSFVTLLSPQIIFELRHNFVNTKAFFDFLLREGEFKTTAGVGFYQLSPFTLYQNLFNWLLAARVNLLGLFLAVFSGLTGLYVLIKNKDFKGKNLGLVITLLWIALGVFLVPLYRGQIYDYYLGFLFAAPFLLFAFSVSYFSQKRWGKVLAFLVIIFLVGFNLTKTNALAKIGPNSQIERSKIVAQTISNDVGDKKFNVALLSTTGDFMGLNYRYFLELSGKHPEDYGNYQNIDVLYVIEEKKWVSPEELGLWEVGTFGPSVSTRDWRFDFQVMIYRLEHK